MDACAAHPDENTRQCGKGIRRGEMAGINVWATQIKSLTRRLRRSARAKEGRKMINCDYSYVATILLILLAVAAGLLVYALCVASKNADELADSMYSRMIQHNISMDNHSHWGE
jgi:hypothetical protein